MFTGDLKKVAVQLTDAGVPEQKDEMGNGASILPG